VQPGSGGAPVALRSYRGHFKNLGRFFEIQASKEPQLHDLRFARIDLRQRFQRAVERYHVNVFVLTLRRHDRVV
jgi:hypothetical protein